MKKCRWLFVAIFFTYTYGQWVKTLHRKRINEDAVNPIMHWIDLPLDHFDVLDNRTYKGRFLTNDQFYKKRGPIIVYVGGEWEIADYGVMGGVAFQLARKFNGFVFYPEHRYFGKSRPFPRPVPADNLRFLTVDQALADMMYSLNYIKTTVEGLKNSQVITVGASYAGALAIWSRLKYPHIISASYNCGGVINPAPINEDYYEIVYNIFKKISTTCADIIKAASFETIELAQSAEGVTWLNKYFATTRKRFGPLFTWNHTILLSFNPQIWPVYRPLQICYFLETNTTGSPIERLRQMFFATPMEDVDDEIYREWFFLVCNGIGNIQVTTENNFGNIMDHQKQLNQMCIDTFGHVFNNDYYYRHTNRSEILFGSNKPDVTKVLSVHGTHDPWKTSCIVDDLNDEAPVVFIEDATHCLEVGEEQDDETPQVAQAKFEILEQLSKWIV